MISKERLSKINGLSLSDMLDIMDEASFEAYCNALNLFIDTYPNREYELKNTFDKNNRTLLIKNLEALSELLLLIYANDLAQRCKKLISDITAADGPPFEDPFIYLLTAVSGLSINIQMALSGERPGAKARPARTDSGKVILAVDDVPLVLHTLQLIMADTEYKFIGLTSGRDALAYISRNTPDLFILDIEMPNMDGYTLAQEIRDRGQIAPIIFLTGNATKDYVFRAIQAGAADFVVKPVNRDQVLETVERFMRN